jgi:hypothetical protein
LEKVYVEISLVYFEKIVYYIQNYELVCDILHKRSETLKSKDLNDLKVLTYLIKVFPQFILIYAKLCKYTIPEYIKQIADSSQLRNPKGPIASDFNFNEYTKICNNPKYRYIVNDKYSNVTSIMDKNRDALSNDEKMKLVNYRMFLNMSDQCRWGNIWTQILSLLFYRDVASVNHSLVNLPDHQVFGDKLDVPRYGADLAPVQIMMYLIRNYKTLPYYTNDSGNLLVNNIISNDLFFSLPTMLSSFCELTVQNIGCVMIGDILNSAIELRLLAGEESFGTYLLERKGTYTDVMKLLYAKLPRHARYQYVDDKCQKASMVLVDNFKEIWYSDDEEEKLEKMLLKTQPSFVRWFNIIRRLISITKEPTEVTELIRFASMVCIGYANPGIFYKTSLVLEAEASIKPQIHATIETPEVKEYIVDSTGFNIPYKYDWEKLRDNRQRGQEPNYLQMLYFRYKDSLNEAANSIKEIDFTGTFVRLLTNNSQGIKVEIGQLGITEDDADRVRVQIFSKLSNARLISFLIDADAFNRFESFIERLRIDNLCTIRYQVNRRARIVEIVSNVDQLAYAPLLAVFEELKLRGNENGAIGDIIAVGKQKGGAIDMVKQLYGTGNPEIINNSSDVSGMDASTQPPVYKVFGQAFIDWLDEHKYNLTEKYFPCGPTHFKKLDRNGKLTDEKYLVSGLAQVLLYVSSMENGGKEFILRDGFFTESIRVANTFFSSGKYNTTGQHTEVLSYVLKEAIEEFKGKYPNVSVRIEGSKFGDDSRESIEWGGEVQNKTEMTREFIDVELRILKSLGYKIDVLLSRCYSDFLQQAAVCGVICPKPSRSSVYCDERGETKSRDPIATIKIMREVLSSASQRMYAIENVMTLLASIWLCISIILIRSKSPEILFKTTWSNNLFLYMTGVYVVIPFITISMPPINFSNKVIQGVGGQLMKLRSFSTIAGDNGWIWLMNQVFDDKDWFELTEVDSEYLGKKGYVTLYGEDYLLRPSIRFYSKAIVREFEIDIALNMLQYSRVALLKGLRRESVETDVAYLAGIADQYRNGKKLNESKLATDILFSEFNLALPKHVTYYGQSQAKIEQAIEAVEELPSELPSIDDVVINFLIHAATVPNSKVIAKLDGMAVKYEFMNDEYDKTMLNTDLSTNLPLLPGYHVHSCFGMILKLAGDVFKSGGALAKINLGQITHGNARYDYETAIEYVQKAQGISPKAEGLVFEALGFTQQERSEIQDLIKSLSPYAYQIEYADAFSPANYFGISGLVSNFNYQWRCNQELPAKIEFLFDMFTRAILFSSVEYFNFKKLKFTVSSFTYKYIMLPLRSRLFTRIASRLVVT